MCREKNNSAKKRGAHNMDSANSSEISLSDNTIAVENLSALMELSCSTSTQIGDGASALNIAAASGYEEARGNSISNDLFIYHHKHPEEVMTEEMERGVLEHMKIATRDVLLDVNKSFALRLTSKKIDNRLICDKNETKSWLIGNVFPTLRGKFKQHI